MKFTWSSPTDSLISKLNFSKQSRNTGCEIQSHNGKKYFYGSDENQQVVPTMPTHIATGMTERNNSLGKTKCTKLRGKHKSQNLQMKGGGSNSLKINSRNWELTSLNTAFHFDTDFVHRLGKLPQSDPCLSLPSARLSSFSKPSDFMRICTEKLC